MNKILKRILSAGVAVCMLPVFSGTVGVKAAPTASCNYSFDKAADFNAIKGTFYEKYQENGTDIWHSAFEHSTAQTDVFGDSTGAVHIKWNKYDAIGKNDKGTDSFFRIPNPDYSGKTYTSFDFKLDNSNSTIQVYNRVPVGGSPKSLAFINASATSLKLLGKTVDASITPDTWYHVSFVTEYDGDKTVTGSAWLNGEKVITDAQTVYAQKPDCIDGTTNAANFLTFVCYYNKAGETGAWFDNLTFNKAENLNINNMTVTPENGEVIESGDITCTFGADVDAATLDTNDITLTKDGTEIAFESAQLSANKLRLRIADADITPGAAFEITLPEAEDVIGNSIEESKRIISYSVEAPEPEAPLELVSPKNGTYVARGDALVLAADAEEAADAVSFWSNGEKLGDGVKNGDLWTYEWQPRRYGEYEITAKYGEHEKSADVTVMKSTVQSGVWALSGSNLSTGAPVYSGTDGRKPAYAMNGTKAVDSYSATDPKITVTKGGIYTLEADVYTDSNGDGVTPALSTAPNAMKNSMNMFIIQGGNLYAKRGGDMWAEGVFGKNEWHTFKTVIDMTGSVNVYDVFVDGIQYADDIEFSNANFTELVGRIKIQLTNTAEGDVFMDNVRLSTLTEASSVYVLTTSPANGTYVEAGDGVMLTASLADDFGDAVDFESVSFSVNGEYVGEGEKISDKQYGIMWTPEAGGKVIVRIDATAEDQEFEKEFELEVFDQYNKTSVTNRYFTYNAGKIVLESDGETSATTSNAGDTSIAVNLIGFKEQGSESGSSCYVQINANKVTKGFVVYEFDVYVTNKEQGIRVYNRPDGTNVPDTPVNFVKGKVCYGSESGATVDTGYTYEANKWYNVKVVWDVDNARRDLYLDGVQIVSGAPVRFSAEKNISQIRGEITNLWKSAGIVTIKNEAVRFASVAPVAQSIAAYDADGKELDIANLDVSKAASIEVTYSQALLAKNINSSNIKLRRGYGKQIEVSDVTVSAKGDNAVKITLGENALDASAHYILTLDSVANSFGVVSDIKEFEIRTAADVKGMYQASFTLNGNEISDITELFEGNTVVFEAKAISPKAEKCYAVITVNTADGKLAAMAVTPVSFDSANSETDVTASLKLNFTPSEGDVMKAFLWDANTLPFGDEFILD